MTSNPVLMGSSIATMDTWYHVQTTFSAAVQADHLAIRLNPELSWTGTMYVDTVEITGP